MAAMDVPEEAAEERDLLVARLIELIRTATDEEIDYIGESDLGAAPIQVTKHKSALRTIIFKRNGHMTEKHAFQPGEVISIVAEDGGEHLDRAFEIATGILMINALRDGDADGVMSLCWAENGPVYRDVEVGFLEPLLLGFRWLSENAAEWTYLQDPETVAPIPTRGEILALRDSRFEVRGAG